MLASSRSALATASIVLAAAACTYNSTGAGSDHGPQYEVDSTGTSNGMNSNGPGTYDPNGYDAGTGGPYADGSTNPTNPTNPVNPPSNPSNGTVIGASGGTVTSSDGQARLQIPAGALANDTAVQLVPVPANLGPGQAGTAYEAQPPGLMLGSSAALWIRYHSAPTGLNVLSSDAQNGAPGVIPGAVYNTATTEIGTLVDVFATWALGSAPSDCNGQCNACATTCASQNGATAQQCSGILPASSANMSSFIGCVASCGGPSACPPPQPTCGAAGQACCTSGMTCNASLTCIWIGPNGPGGQPAICEQTACGGYMQPCCGPKATCSGIGDGGAPLMCKPYGSYYACQ